MQEKNFPALYGAADSASKKAQKIFFLALGGNLACLVTASIISTINKATIEFAYGQAAVLFLSLALVVYLAHEKPQRSWYRSRALAESIKTISWRYMMKAEPYDANDQASRKIFLDVLKKLIETNPDAVSRAINFLTDEQLTTEMKRIRSESLADRVEIYRRKRILDQLGWYRKKALENRDLSSGWFVLLVVVNMAAIVFALMRIGDPSVTEWPTDIMIAAAGSIMTWLQTKRFQELAASYGLTAHEISLLNARLEDHQQSEVKFSKFVGDAEMAFSREHTQWQARADEE